MTCRSIWVSIAAAWVIACNGDIQDGASPATWQDTRAPSAGLGADPGSAGAGTPPGSGDPGVPPEGPGAGMGSAGAGSGDFDPTSCDPGAALGKAPLRRLTAAEYRNTVADLFEGISLPQLELSSDNGVLGFDNDAQGQSVSALLVEQYDAAAAQLAEAAVAQLDRWAPCTPRGDGEACGLDIARALGERAYRRPLENDEIARFEGFVRTNLAAFGFERAVRMFVHGVLSSPSFLYRPELGVATTGGVRPLTDHELASRLSYLLWRSMPDAALLDAAATGALATEAGLRAQVARMLEDPRAREAISDFHRQWFELDRLDHAALDEEQFPELAEVRDDLKASATRFLDHQFWEGSVQSLFTAAQGFVNDALAPVFGVPAPGSDALVLTDLDPETRAGVLTQPGVLASTSHGLSHSPILRGVFVLRNVLCTSIPAPPAGVVAAIPDDPEGEILTTRQRIEESHGTAECSGCHDMIDPLGFTFEHYDALGRYQEHENGVPVDASGTVQSGGDLDGDYANAIELARQLAQSDDVHACVATQWYRYALGRTESRDDRCRIAALGGELASTGDMKAMLTSLIMSPAFRNLPASEAP